MRNGIQTVQGFDHLKRHAAEIARQDRGGRGVVGNLVVWRG